MTATELITRLKATLTPILEENGGQLEVAKSLADARVFLSSAPRRWRVILLFDGFSSHSASRYGKTYYRVATIIQQREGFRPKTGDEIHVSAHGGDPFLKLVEDVSELMRALRFPNGDDADCAGFTLEEGDWIDAERDGHAFNLGWQLEAALPHYEATITVAPLDA